MVSSITLDEEVLNIGSAIKDLPKEKTIKKLERCFEIVDEFIKSKTSTEKEKIIWLKKDNKDPNLLILGFERKKEGKNYPSITSKIKSSYTIRGKIRTIECLIINACNEWGVDLNKIKSEEGRGFSFSLNGTTYTILF